MDQHLRAVYFRLLRRVREQNATRLNPGLYGSVRLEALLAAIVRGVVHHYREHRTLPQALQKMVLGYLGVEGG